MALPQIARYSALGPSLWSFGQLPDGTSVEPTPLTAGDGGESQGTLYTRGGERIVLMLMHPRGDMQRHYAIPGLLEGGYACWGHAGRFLNNDVNCIKERLLLDVGAAVSHLRDRGFERVILMGNSGGGALYSFYQSQAATPPPGRLTDTAAGDPCNLNDFDLPEADAIVQLATHLGEGKLMNVIIDPSVVDENDPLSLDPTLDMYDPSNGFQTPPQPSKYSEEFLTRYRAAQLERVARIDAIARGYVADQRHYLARVGAPDFESLPVAEQQWCLRRGLLGRYMAINRTEANPAYTDPSLHPNDRPIGSYVTGRPDVFNYMEAGFGKIQTPRAWLSTWSGLSSRASTLDALPRITIPTLVVAYTGDGAVLPCDTDAIYAASPAKDKEMASIKGDHLGYGPGGLQDRSGQQSAVERVTGWIRDRF